MQEEIDARGDKCPLPVVKAKKALKGIDEGSVRVRVDNETAVHNLTALAKTMKCASESETVADDDFFVTIMKAADADVDAAEGFEATCVPSGNGVVVAVASRYMGVGDDTLGETLMKGFIFALTQLDDLPRSVLFYNGGVYWTCEGSAALDDLKTLASEGVQVLSCGTCLSHYDLTEKLAVGEVTNMYTIVETQAAASVVVRP